MTIRSTESARKPHKSAPIMAAKVSLNDESMDDKKTIDYYMPKCIRPDTALQKTGRALVSFFAVSGSVSYAYGAYFVWHSLADKCIALLMLSLTLIWVMIGLQRSLKHLEFYAKVSLSMMCTAIGMLICVPIHVASVEVMHTGDYQSGMFFGVRCSVFIFFFAVAFWYLAWICFATDRVLAKVKEILKKKREQEPKQASH